MFVYKQNLLFAAVRAAIGKTFFRTVYKEPFSYENKYLGNFDYHDQTKYPRKFSAFKEEELLQEVHAIKAMKIENPSPFHVVRRIKTMSKLPWNQKVTLRRLNLHSSYNGECVIVPNTPQFNALLFKVKHLLQLKPAIFPNGRVPTIDDIGAIKVCPYTGKVEIDEKLRLLEKRVNIDKPMLFQGNHLRGKINRLYGITHPHYLK